MLDAALGCGEGKHTVVLVVNSRNLSPVAVSVHLASKNISVLVFGSGVSVFCGLGTAWTLWS